MQQPHPLLNPINAGLSINRNMCSATTECSVVSICPCRTNTPAVELTELVVVETEEPCGPTIWYGQMIVVVVDSCPIGVSVDSCPTGAP